MNIGGVYRGNYIQTADYTYALATANHPMFYNIFPNLHFKAVNGKVVQIMIGKGQDLSILPDNRNSAILITSFIIAIFCILYFVCAPIVNLIYATKHRAVRSNQASGNIIICHWIMLLSGTVAVINNFACLFRFLAINMFRSYNEMKLHIIGNNILFAVCIISIVFFLGFSIQENGIVKNKRFFVTVLFSLLLFTLLIVWNFLKLLG
ncbi:hypothetical protein [Leadbettera azotonutricia]|uniref:Uncharacterized protein n=1 Tax=Leadbettera azotonutricia (strain ATCC BAA-888 / DSM 13862 / ZAS-9) TaxID=545695 RepID=F5YCP2_LEAAZ|nr:hypothetical protein [Leadbettera azotonutricia]AEF81965.1 hypothetical protein TREAZ_1711 [Leadbettera azotonutricia ZAS-9]